MMAARATKDAVQRAVEGPDYDAALAIINGRLQAAKDAQSKASGNASQAWGDVEKLGVNKRGAQMFARVQAIEDESERQDQLRTFQELCRREGIGIEVDLVDRAQAPVADPAPAAAQPAAPPGDDDLVEAGEAVAADRLAEKPKRKPPVLKAVDGGAAKAAAQSHLSGKPAPDAVD